MPRFAVIDTETTWRDRVMSLGAVIADSATLQPVETKYYILDPEFREGGMYSSALILRREDKNAFSAREEAMDDLLSCLRAHGAKQVFAYNARFDRAHLPELASFGWYDIMALAAYRTYNQHIPRDAPLYSTGRLRRGYDVEPILRLLSGNSAYRETHNALQDALDELTIMELLGHPPAAYRPL